VSDSGLLGGGRDAAGQAVAIELTGVAIMAAEHSREEEEERKTNGA
jgi:hypothetical protein